jgi:hypothetical protein
MCKEMPVIPVNKVVDPKRIIGKKWMAKEEESHKGLLLGFFHFSHPFFSDTPPRLGLLPHGRSLI